MAYNYYLIAKKGRKVVAMLNWLGLDVYQREIGLSKSQTQFLEWLQEHSPEDVQWVVEGEYVHDDVEIGYTEVHEIPAVQQKAIDLGITDEAGISSMATIMNCRVSRRLKNDGNWEEELREKVTPTYPRLKWDNGRFVVEQQKKRKASAAASAAAPQKKTKTTGSKTGTIGKVTLLNTTATAQNGKRWVQYNSRNGLYIKMKTSTFVGAQVGVPVPVTVFATIRGREKKIAEGNAICKCEEGFFRVVETTFRERTTNADGVICLPTGGYLTRAGIVHANYKSTQRKVMSHNGLPPVGCAFTFDEE